MANLVTHPTSTAQWYALVCEAQNQSGVFLGEAMESYSVFLLMRFIDRSDLINSILALDFLETTEQQGSEQLNTLKTLGDKCLLLSSLYPEIALKRNVSVSYFHSMGQNAYLQVHHAEARDDLPLEAHSTVYADLVENFSQVTTVLSAMKNISVTKNDALSSLEAHDSPLILGQHVIQ